MLRQQVKYRRARLTHTRKKCRTFDI